MLCLLPFPRGPDLQPRSSRMADLSIPRSRQSQFQRMSHPRPPSISIFCWNSSPRTIVRIVPRCWLSESLRWTSRAICNQRRQSSGRACLPLSSLTLLITVVLMLLPLFFLFCCALSGIRSSLLPIRHHSLCCCS
jgi:hypothetical protein